MSQNDDEATTERGRQLLKAAVASAAIREAACNPSDRRALYLEERIALARKALNRGGPAFFNDDSQRERLRQFFHDVMWILDGDHHAGAVARLSYLDLKDPR